MPSCAQGTSLSPHLSAGLPERMLVLGADLNPHQDSFKDSVSSALKTEVPHFNTGMFMFVTLRGVRSTLTDAVHYSESLICDPHSVILVLRSCYASILGSLVSPLESPFAMLAGQRNLILHFLQSFLWLMMLIGVSRIKTIRESKLTMEKLITSARVVPPMGVTVANIHVMPASVTPSW